MTTLEDVFLRVEGEATTDRGGTMVAASIQPAAEEQGYLAVTPGHPPTVDYWAALTFSHVTT